jgi:hypothetical protein
MSGILHHIQIDAPEYTALVLLFLVAVIANMPHPVKFGYNIWYTWLYDSLQAFMAARNPHPTQPGQPPELPQPIQQEKKP